MKAKNLIFAVLALVVAGCSKANDELVAVTFQVGGIRTGEIATKAGPEDILAATAPTGEMSLKINSTTNTARRYTAKPGEAVLLPADTYQVTGTYTPTTAVEVWRGIAYKEPRYRVSTTINVTGANETYTLPAQYECFAMIIDFTESEKYAHTNAGTTIEDVTQWAVQGDYGVLYVYARAAWDSSMPYNVMAYPKDLALGEVKTYHLIMNGTDGTPVEYGKWYCFVPGQVERLSGTIVTDFPTWERGN